MMNLHVFEFSILKVEIEECDLLDEDAPIEAPFQVKK